MKKDYNNFNFSYLKKEKVNKSYIITNKNSNKEINKKLIRYNNDDLIKNEIWKSQTSFLKKRKTEFYKEALENLDKRNLKNDEKKLKKEKNNVSENLVECKQTEDFENIDEEKLEDNLKKNKIFNDKKKEGFNLVFENDDFDLENENEDDLENEDEDNNLELEIEIESENEAFDLEIENDNYELENKDDHDDLEFENKEEFDLENDEDYELENEGDYDLEYENEEEYDLENEEKYDLENDEDYELENKKQYLNKNTDKKIKKKPKNPNFQNSPKTIKFPENRITPQKLEKDKNLISQILIKSKNSFLELEPLPLTETPKNKANTIIEEIFQDPYKSLNFSDTIKSSKRQIFENSIKSTTSSAEPEKTRYFTNPSPDLKIEKCYFCLKRGHSKKNCELKKKANCTFCLGEHKRANCANKIGCFICLSKTHLRIDCDKKKKKIKCHRCGKIGHFRSKCEVMIFDEFAKGADLEEGVRCLNCKGFGHFSCFKHEHGFRKCFYEFKENFKTRRGGVRGRRGRMERSLNLQYFGDRFRKIGKNNGNFGKKNNNFGKKNRVYGNKRGGFGNKRGGFGNKRGNFGNKKGRYENKKGSFGNKRGNFENKRGNFENNSGSYENKRGNYENKKGNNQNKRNGFTNDIFRKSKDNFNNKMKHYKKIEKKKKIKKNKSDERNNNVPKNKKRVYRTNKQYKKSIRIRDLHAQKKKNFN